MILEHMIWRFESYNTPCTICTKNRVKYFGDIVNTKETIVLSSIGKIACEYWKEIPKHFPLVKLREFVIMPNHIHGILVLDRGECSLAKKPKDNVPVETRHALSLQNLRLDTVLNINIHAAEDLP